MNLQQFVVYHTNRGECQCGQCIDRGDRPDPTGHTADMIFFKVARLDKTTARSVSEFDQQTADLKKEFAELSNLHKGERVCSRIQSLVHPVDVFDGKEHNYMELGGWLGSQETALRYMALGYLLGVFNLLTPRTMLGDLADDAMAMHMAGLGYVSIVARAGDTSGTDKPQTNITV